MLEVAPRLHGPKFSLYAMPAVVEDYLRVFFETISGGDSTDFSFKINGNFFKSSVIQSKPGKIEELVYKGEPLSKNYLGSEIMIFKDVGDTVKIGKSSHDAVGYVMVVSDSYDGAELAVEDSLSSVEIKTIN